jgi:hypothetical protein
MALGLVGAGGHVSGKPAIFRAVFFTVALVAVLLASRWLRSGAGNGFFQAVGLAAPPLPAGFVAFNFCPTRIRSIQWPSGARIEESSAAGIRGNWRLAGPAGHDLPYLEVERWLSRHCSKTGRLLNPGEPIGAFAPFWEIEYVDGTKATLERAGVSGFRWRGQAVESREIQGATAELAGLAGLGSGA